jgi:hypothetical protein
MVPIRSDENDLRGEIPRAKVRCNSSATSAKEISHKALIAISADAHEPVQRAAGVAGERPQRLDETVFAAYGWPADLSDDELLAKLLALNLERASGK